MIINILYIIKLLFTLLILYILKLVNIHSDLMFNELYKDIVRNGCLTIKFTQWIISRVNILYDKTTLPESIKQFNNLLEHCPFHKIEWTESLFYDSFKCNINDIFYDIKPIASGSIGQIYKAKFRHNDKVVAIKVRHPNIDREIFFTKTVIKFILFILNNFSNLKNIFPVDFDDFFNALESQVDLRLERNNLLKLRDNFKDSDLVIIPEVYFYSKDIIVMTYEDGKDFDNITDSTEKYYAGILLILFARQGFLIDNFVHADLHRGNWKVTKRDNKTKIIIYDVGLCFNGPSVEFNRNYIRAWETRNLKDISHYTTELLKESNNVAIKNKLENEFEPLTSRCISTISINTVLNIVLYFVKKNNLIMNGTYLNIMITLALIEDIFRKTGVMPNIEETKIIDIFSKQYVDNINFCETNKVFLTLSNYLKEIVDLDTERALKKNLNNPDAKEVSIII